MSELISGPSIDHRLINKHGSFVNTIKVWHGQWDSLLRFGCQCLAFSLKWNFIKVESVETQLGGP